MEKWTVYLKREKIDNYDIKLINAKSVAKFAREYIDIANIAHEEIWAIYMDCKCKPIGVYHAGIGTVLDCAFPIQDIYRAGLIANAAAVILIHNHPNGDPTPSKIDRDILLQMQRFGKMVGLRIFDNIVVTETAERSTQDAIDIEKKRKKGGIKNDK